MKIFTGQVISKKMAKTAVVAVTRVIVHTIYKKRVKRIKKYQVHDELDQAGVGQRVRFVASKPFSRTKKWKIVNIVQSKEGNVDGKLATQRKLNKSENTEKPAETITAKNKREVKDKKGKV